VVVGVLLICVGLILILGLAKERSFDTEKLEWQR
jgi:uncharacterized membrane protein HdeD (DUF308 family)